MAIRGLHPHAMTAIVGAEEAGPDRETEGGRGDPARGRTRDPGGTDRGRRRGNVIRKKIRRRRRRGRNGAYLLSKRII